MKILEKALLLFTTLSSMIANIKNIKEKFEYKYYLKKTIIYFAALIFLITSYVFACISLYGYLIPYWGESLSAFSLCLLSLIVAFVLVMSTNLLKHKKKVTIPLESSNLERRLEQYVNVHTIEKYLREASPKILIPVLGVVAVSTILTTYFLFLRKKKMDEVQEKKDIQLYISKI